MNTRIRSIALTTGVVLFGGVGVASALSSIGNDSDVPSPTTAPFSRPVVGESAGSMTSGPVTSGAVTVGSSSTTTTSVNPLGTLTVAGTPMVPPSGAIGGSIGGDDDHDDDHEEHEDHDEDHDDRDEHDDDHDDDEDDD